MTPHRWDVTEAEAIAIQNELAKSVDRTDDLPATVQFVAGVDVAYSKDDSMVFAAVVVTDVQTMKTVETASAVGQVAFPYVPGLFAFRELPHLLSAMEKLQRQPDLVICDGQGIAHPRRFGLASHLGVWANLPTIGCGKTRHIGEYDPPGDQRGDCTDLIEDGEVIGKVLRTQPGVNPLFVSIGHRISLDTAQQWVLRLADSVRQPEPTRRANEFVCKLRSES